MKILFIINIIAVSAFASFGQTNFPAPLYLHFGFELQHLEVKRLLSTQIHLGERIFVEGNDYWELTGQIDMVGTNMMADLRGADGFEAVYYKGPVTLEKPFDGQGGVSSGGAYPMWFVVSTNADSKAIVEREKTEVKKRLGE